MTFQNLYQEFRKWNENIIRRVSNAEKVLLFRRSNTCVHIIQKTLMAVRMSKMKNPTWHSETRPVCTQSIHFHCAQTVLKRLLCLKKIPISAQLTTDLIVQKHSREIELIVNDCILNAVRHHSIEKIFSSRLYRNCIIEEEITRNSGVWKSDILLRFEIRLLSWRWNRSLLRPQRLTIENIDNNPKEHVVQPSGLRHGQSEKDELSLLKQRTPDRSNITELSSYKQPFRSWKCALFRLKSFTSDTFIPIQASQSVYIKTGLWTVSPPGCH
jgi:hypothetical protein